MSEPFLIGATMTGGYGNGPDILHACTIEVQRGEIAVIVGPNGAGKSTAMKAIFGMLALKQGSVELDGEDISQLSPQDRVVKGMGFVPQNSNIFSSMTVEENLEMGAFIRTDDFSGTLDQVYDLFPILREKRLQVAGELSGGQRQQVAVGRALMTQPKVLMLDEPTAGMARADTNNTIDLLKQIRDTRDITIAIIEHDMHVVFSLAERITVLAQGTPLVEETPENIKGHPKVREAYLGEAQV